METVRAETGTAAGRVRWSQSQDRASFEDAMRLTHASSYALHALAFLAAQEKNAPVASHQIARARGIPERFLLKVLKPLVAARVLVSTKGPHGGYRLARPANAVSMLDVVEAVDGPLNGQSSHPRDDVLEHRIDTICRDVTEHLRRHLQKVRLAELASKASKAKR
jgi:Rrf2 family protein